MIKEFVMQTSHKVLSICKLNFVNKTDIKNLWDQYYANHEEEISQWSENKEMDKIAECFPSIAYTLIENKLSEVSGEVLENYKEEINIKRMFLLRVLTENQINTLIA